jgi:hypothetical protein
MAYGARGRSSGASASAISVSPRGSPASSADEPLTLGLGTAPPSADASGSDGTCGEGLGGGGGGIEEEGEEGGGLVLPSASSIEASAAASGCAGGGGGMEEEGLGFRGGGGGGGMAGFMAAGRGCRGK